MSRVEIFFNTSGQPVLTHSAVTQECSSLLAGNTLAALHSECDVGSVAMIYDLSGAAGI